MSYRFLAKRLDIDPGFLVHIIQGSKHLAEKNIAAFAKYIGLNKRESAYFERLVLFGKARGEREIAECFKLLMELRDTCRREVNTRQYQYYLHWYIPAIRCLIAATEFTGNYAALGAQLVPSISAKEAEQSVKLLEKLGMIKRGSGNVWETLDQHISTGDAWTSHTIRGFQKQTLELAVSALENLPKEDREISTLTFSIPKSEINAVQEMVREFRSRMANWAISTQDGDSVFQMNIQVFPLART